MSNPRWRNFRKGKYLYSQLSKAQKAGASSFRFVGDMIGLRDRASTSQLFELEAEIDDRVIRKFPVAILCVYDARKFSGVELLNTLKTHRDTFRYPLGRALA